MNPVVENIDKIRQACLEHNIEQLFFFGSVNTDKFNEQSDIDILVQFNDLIEPPEYFNNYMDFKEKLESILGREVDIVENQAVRNPIFRRILDRDKQLIYERKSA
jgi:predicted nucleotidyltransferase